MCEYERREEESEVEHYVRLTKMFEESTLSFNERADIMQRVYVKKSTGDSETSFNMNEF